MTTSLPSTNESVKAKDVSRVLRMIRPSIRSQGGDVRLVDVDDRSVVVHLGVVNDAPFPFEVGSGVIERIIRSRIPQIEHLQVVN